MKKFSILFLSLIIITSCNTNSDSSGYNSKKEPKNLLDKEEQLAHDFENNKLTNPFDFFRGLVAELSLINMHFVGIQKLKEDGSDSKEKMKDVENGYISSKKSYEKLLKIKPRGIGGDKFLRLATDFSKASTDIFKAWIDAGEINFEKHRNLLNIVFEKETALINFQDVYAKDNNFSIRGSVNTDEMYEESKKESENNK